MRSPNSYILATFIRDTWCFDKKKKKKKKIGKEWVSTCVRPRVTLFVECAIQ